MSDAFQDRNLNTVVAMAEWKSSRDKPPTSTGGGGDNTSDHMEARVKALEDAFSEIRTGLKELRDGQHAAALAASDQKGNDRERQAEVNGKLANLVTVSEGLRRDLDKLPSKFDIVTIMILVVGGLAGTATFLKAVWPIITKAIAP